MIWSFWLLPTKYKLTLKTYKDNQFVRCWIGAAREETPLRATQGKPEICLQKTKVAFSSRLYSNLFISALSSLLLFAFNICYFVIIVHLYFFWKLLSLRQQVFIFPFRTFWVYVNWHKSCQIWSDKQMSYSVMIRMPLTSTKWRKNSLCSFFCFVPYTILQNILLTHQWMWIHLYHILF